MVFRRTACKLTNFLFIELNYAKWWNIDGGYKGSNACNQIEGTDGSQFHPDVKKDEKLWIFSTDLCRSMFLTFQVHLVLICRTFNFGQFLKTVCLRHLERLSIIQSDLFLHLFD